MKIRTIARATGVVTLASLWPLAAQETETTETTKVTEHADGSVTETTTEVTRTFNPEVEKRVVKFFDPYKSERFGLPPTVVTRIQAEEIPATWRAARINPGVVVEEEHRTHLVEAPPELIEVLPEPTTEEVRYYVAGSNVVAVNKEYRVVDSIHIPSIKITVDE